MAELSNYEEFSRRELPRIFRSTLEEAVTNEVEEQLRTRLIDIIQECQDRVFSMYRGSRGISTPSFHSETRDLSQDTGIQISERPEPALPQESQNRQSDQNIAKVGKITTDSPLEAIGTNIGSNFGDENPLVQPSQPGTSAQILVEHTARNNPSNDFAQPNELYKSVENSGQYEGSENPGPRQIPDQQVADHYPDISFEELSNMDFFSSNAEMGSTIGGLDLGYWRNEGITAQYGE